MSTPAQRKMTVDEFLAWAEGQVGRWESTVREGTLTLSLPGIEVGVTEFSTAA